MSGGYRFGTARVLRALKLKKARAAFLAYEITYREAAAVKSNVKKKKGWAKAGEGRRDRRERRNGSRTTLHYLKGVSIKGDKTILQVSELQSPLLPPKLWCNWSCSGFGMRGLASRKRERERTARDLRCITASSNRSYFYWELNTPSIYPDGRMEWAKMDDRSIRLFGSLSARLAGSQTPSTTRREFRAYETKYRTPKARCNEREVESIIERVRDGKNSIHGVADLSSRYNIGPSMPRCIATIARRKISESNFSNVDTRFQKRRKENYYRSFPS